MGWGLDKDKVHRQWEEWTRFTHQARGDQPAGLEDMLGRPFAIPAWPHDTSPGDLIGTPHDTSPGDEPFVLDPIGVPENDYALAQLAQLAEAGVLSPREFAALQQRVRGF
jgi:hypothetical protein